MTAPSGPSQAACVRRALEQSRLAPSEVTITELHGTGTKLGDPIEFGSIKNVQQHRAGNYSGAPIFKGAGKTLFGHMELNAGMMHICKQIIQLTRGVAVPNSHLRQFTPHGDLDNYAVHVPTELSNLSFDNIVSGTSSFGFGGTNCRVDLWSRPQLRDNRTVRWTTARSHPEAEGRRRVLKSEYVRGSDIRGCVVCPLCNSYMCSLCSMVIVDPAAKHRCAAVRDSSAAYDRCSICYKGRYKFGTPAPRCKIGRSFLYFGSWDGWSKGIEAMVNFREGTNTIPVRLGDVNREQFMFKSYVGKGEDGTVYPPVACSGRHSPFCGPDQNCEGRHWMIDGHAEGVPVGTVFLVTTHNKDGKPDIWWDIAPPEVARMFPDDKFQHTYSVVGSAVDGEFLQMQRRNTDSNTWETMIRIGSACREELQVVRDGDRAQTLYPAEIPGKLLGPDALSDGRKWIVHGAASETVPVTLHILDGRITLTIRGGSSREQIWKNLIH